MDCGGRLSNFSHVVLFKILTAIPLVLVVVGLAEVLVSPDSNKVNVDLLLVSADW